MYAVIRSGGKQYRVAPGDILHLEKLDGAPGASLAWEAGGGVVGESVLAVRDDSGAWRAPAGTRVTGTLLAQAKDAKVLVFHYKRKKQYKKLLGHRQRFSRVRVDAIQLPA